MAMELILTVAKYQTQAPSDQMTHRFGPDGGTIGRSSQCDWVLSDPARFISSVHAQVICTGDQFQLTDRSMNGTFLNGLDGSIGKGNTVPLAPGDTLQIGEYVISVTVEGADAPAPAAADVDWFDAPTAAEMPQPQGFDPQPVQPPAPAPDIEAPFFDTPSTPQDERELFEAAEPEMESADPFMPSQAPEEEFFVPPQAAGSGQIPDDWDPMLSQITSASEFREQFSGSPAAQSQSQSQAPAPAPPQPPQAEPTPVANAPMPAAGPPAQSVAPAANEAVSPPRAPSRPPAAPVPAPAPAPAPPTAPAPGSAMPQRGSVSQGLAVGDLAMDTDVLNLQAGQALRAVIEGIMEILTGRAQVKDEFRLSQTRIGPAMNNPLKFSPTVDEAIKRLFGVGESGFLGAEEGLQQAIDDIKAHQVAMLAGMQAGLKAVLAFFEPDHLADQLADSSGLASKMPGVREARLWTHFTSVYERMAKDAEGDFHRLFAKEFADAYEQQIQILARARRSTPQS